MRGLGHTQLHPIRPTEERTPTPGPRSGQQVYPRIEKLFSNDGSAAMPMSVEQIIQQILQGKAQSPQVPPPLVPRSSTVDFAQAANSLPPPDIPQALLNPQPDPVQTGGIPTPTPSPQRQALAQMMPKPRNPMMSQHAEAANYTTSGTDRSKGAGRGSSAMGGKGGLY